MGAFQAGHRKVGGRKAGVPNKDSIPVQELCNKHNVSPIEVMIEFLKPIEPGLKPEELIGRITQRFNAAKELAQYLYPKRKALEIDANVNMELAKKAQEYAELPKEEQIPLMEAELKRLKGE